MKRICGAGLGFVLAMAVVEPTAQAQYRSRYNRVTTTRQEVMAAPGHAGRAVGPGMGLQSNSDPLRPYHPHATIPQAGDHPTSSWRREPRKPGRPAPVIIRSTPHTFYPGMRPGQVVIPNVSPTPVQGRCTPGRAEFLGR